MDPDLQIGRQKFFLALQASVWSIKKGGGQAPLTPPLDLPLNCTLDIRERGKWPLDMHVVLPGGCTCKIDTNLFFLGGGGVLLSSSFMRVPLVCFDSSFFIVISTCVMLV